jgi:hypothetical protein
MELAMFGFATAIVGLYLLPTVIAAARGHNQTGLLLCFNLGCGWMVWGYGVALVWAIAGETRAEARGTTPEETPVFYPEGDPDGGEPVQLVPRRPVVRRVGRRHPGRCAGLRRVG